MTTRSRLLLLVLSAAASAGCGGTVVFSEDGGDGGAGGNDRPPVAVTTGGGSAPSGPTVVTVSNGPDVTVGGSECLVTEFFAEPACDDCFLDSCCAEAEACVEDFELCLTPEGELDESNRLGAAVVACATASCSEECGLTSPTAEQFCDSGILLSTDDPREGAAFMGCFNASCCDAFALCTDGGDETALQECLDCLNGVTDDPSRCAPADACAIEACGEGIVFRNVCGSGYVVRGIEDGQCVERACCDEALDCTLNGKQPAACRACVDAGGGPQCDALLACQSEQCGI